ncbi:MAG: LysR family transcriptional regulator [Kluyvera sp.]|uniref:LysR family transcriptional regulator n=1 Tax=Kluyvera sp. TaxID=1538228 RepID=UPI003A8BF31F
MVDLSTTNIRTLLFFIAVYDAQSFSLVARKEGVSPSMISRTMQQFEEAIGQQLFYRNTRSVMPTEAARQLIDPVRAIAEELERAKEALQNRAVVPSGLVRINAPVFFGQRHIAPTIGGLATRYPGLRIELMLTDDFIDPHREAADVIFRIGTLTDSAFHARVFGEQHYHVAASPAYLHRHGAPRTPDELSRHACLVYRGSSGANRWLLRQGEAPWVHYPLTPALVSNNADALLTAALGGMGLVLFPDWLMGDCLKNGTLIKLLADYDAAIRTEAQQIAAIYPNARHPPLNVRAVIDYYVETFGTPPYWQVK